MKTKLENFNLFAGLDNDDIALIEKEMKIVKVKDGDYIIREGELKNNLYLLANGTVCVTKKLTLNIGEVAEDKKLVTLADSQYPVFGEIGLLGKKKRTASVIANSDCVLFELTETSFKKIVKQNYKMGFLIMQNLANIIASRLEKTDNNVVKLATALSLTVFKK